MLTVLLTFCFAMHEERLWAEPIEAGLARQDFVGASFLAFEGECEIAFVARGWADRELGLPIRRDTVFQVMSMTKPVVATLAMVYVDRGVLNLDAPVARYLPEFEQVRTSLGSVHSPTVRELLTHTSGIHRGNPPGVTDFAKRSLTLEDYVAQLAATPFEAEPGVQIRYSGSGFSVLGRVLEVVGGRPLEELLQSEICQPIGMNDTSFFFRASWRGRLARAYRRPEEGWPVVEDQPTRPGAVFANPAGGLYSTVDDMARFLQMIVTGGRAGGRRILSEASVRELLRDQLPDSMTGSEEGLRWGLGWLRYVPPSPIAGSVGHDGAYGTAFWADPITLRIGVFMAQRPGCPTTARDELGRKLGQLPSSSVRQDGMQ